MTTEETNTDPIVRSEAARRRTFAIISHPDAGKTTLTEKLLLYGGCVEVAGAVRSKKNQRSATSDWMELEKQRGISVSSTVLPFEYEGFQINLLDTPGHHDFSEDTYRTLLAADCAVMVLDLAKGIELQTEKLFRVCKLRKIPVITFVNKTDRPGLDALDILSEIESKLGIVAVPQNWPLGVGFDFQGVIELCTRTAHVFQGQSRTSRVEFKDYALSDLSATAISREIIEQTLGEVELVTSAGTEFEEERFLNGEITPTFFGSALTNYGVEHFLKGFLALCPSPRPRMSNVGLIPPDQASFSGFIFKMQANLDPKHRDKVAFMRVCSGKFERDLEILHPRTGKRLRLKGATRVFGQERETVEEAYPGDILGLINPGELMLGDTLCQGHQIQFEPLPQFSPEFFARLRCKDTLRRKQFEKGLEQLFGEGAIQVFYPLPEARSDKVLGAVGELQFDVVRYRLESEYNATSEIEWLPFKFARWTSATPEQIATCRVGYLTQVFTDSTGSTALLFRSPWDAETFHRENPDVDLNQARLK